MYANKRYIDAATLILNPDDPVRPWYGDFIFSTSKYIFVHFRIIRFVSKILRSLNELKCSIDNLINVCVYVPSEWRANRRRPRPLPGRRVVNTHDVCYLFALLLSRLILRHPVGTRTTVGLRMIAWNTRRR